MPRGIGDMFNLAITLFEDEVTDVPHFKPMQGRKDTNFLLRLSKGNELVEIDSNCYVVVKFFCYETVRPTILKEVYTIAPTNPDGTHNSAYNVTIVDNQINIPANIAMTDFAGDIYMTVLVTCNTPAGESVSIPYYYKYSVEPLAGYKMVGGNVNVADYAKIDLSNVPINAFKSKATEAGFTTNDNINDSIKYFSDPTALDASRLRYDAASKVWVFELKNNGNWVEKFRIGESAIVDVLKLIQGSKPTNIPSNEIALYNKQLTIDGQNTMRPLFVLPDGNEYSFVVYDEQNDKVVFRKNNGTLVEIPISTGSGSIAVSSQEGAPVYNASKLLFPFANGLVNDNGTVTVNTSFIVTDENSEIVPDCSIVEVRSDSDLVATQSQGNSNAAVLDFKGIKVDNGDPTELTRTKYFSFIGGKIAQNGEKTELRIQPEVTKDGVRELEGLKTLEVPASGLLTATAEADPDLDGKLYLTFGGLPTRKTIAKDAYNAMELRFPQANVSSTTSGIVTVGTGHSVSKDDDELTTACNAWIFGSGINAESDANNPNGVIITVPTPPQGISITNDDTQPVNETIVAYFPQARIEDGSTVDSKVIKTAIPIESGTDSFDDYTKINFNNNDFTVARDGTDSNKLNVSFGGISVETNNQETPNIKVFDFDKNSFNLNVETAGIATISAKTQQHNGFLAVNTRRQVVAQANAQEVYRLTTFKPNHVTWVDDEILYDQNSGIITLKYSGENGEKQFFKIAVRVSLRRQLREADLGVYLYLANTTDGDYIQDINNETPIVNKTISKDLVSDYIELVTMVSITADMLFRVIIKDDTPNKFVDILDLAMGTSALMVEKVNSTNQPSEALQSYEILTQQSTRFMRHDFGSSYENAKNLIATTPSANQEISADTVLQQDGWLIYYQDEGVYKQNTTPDGSANCFEMVDKLDGFGYFNIAKIFDYEDTWCLHGHEVTAKVDRAEQTGEFAIVPIVWRKRINEYTPKIITGMNNQGVYSTTEGWEVVDASKTVIDAPTPAETTASFTCNFTIPDDAVNFGFMLMPTKQQEHSLIKFTDFAIGCDPTFERWIIEYPEQAIEAQLKQDSKYVKYVQLNTTPYNMSQWYQIPNGTSGDNNYSPLYTGEAQAGGNADITKIYDSTSTDFETLHNKGKWRFGKDGKVQVHYKIPVATDKFADGSDHNTFRIGFVKDTGGGDILQGTPITASLRDINIPKSGNVFNDSVRTNGYANVTFTMDVKENDEYWIALNPINVPRDSGNEGHMYSYPSGLVEFTFLENEYAINLLQSQIAEMQNLLRATSDAITNKAYIEVGYDTNNNKPTLEAKVYTIT